MLDVKEVAERLNVSESLVYGWIADGRLAHVRLGGRGRRGTIRVSEADLDAFLAGHKREALRQDALPVASAREPSLHRRPGAIDLW